MVVAARGLRPDPADGRPRPTDPSKEKAVITPDEEHLLEDTWIGHYEAWLARSRDNGAS
jgi:hypothetical protein